MRHRRHARSRRGSIVISMSNEVIISALILLAAVVLAAVVLGRHFSLTKTASGSFVAKTDEAKSTLKVDKIKAGGSASIASEGNLEAGSIETRRNLSIRIGRQTSKTDKPE